MLKMGAGTRGELLIHLRMNSRLLSLLGVGRELTARLAMLSYTCKFTRNFSTDILSSSLSRFGGERWGEEQRTAALPLMTSWGVVQREEGA